MIRKKIFIAVMLGFSLLLSCSGGSDSSGVNQQQQYQSERIVGLTNFGNTCYINAALQQIMHSPALQREIESNFAANSAILSLMQKFETEYYNNDPQLQTTLSVLVSTLLAFPNMPARGAIGEPANVFCGLYCRNVVTGLSTGGLRLNSFWAAININDITANFNFFKHYVFNVEDTSTTPSTYWSHVSFASLPYKNDITAMTYIVGRGHYVAYIQKNGKWYKANDAMVTEVTLADLNNLLFDANNGVTSVSYR